jgi:hypothetical protein
MNMRLHKRLLWGMTGACLFVWTTGIPPAQAESSVRVISEQVVFVPQEHQLQVMQILTFENAGTKPLPKLEIRLPQGFSHVEFYSGTGHEQLKTTDTGIVDESGLPAGEKQLRFSYQIPLADTGATVTFQSLYPVDAIDLLIPQGSLFLSANNVLPQSEVLDLQGQKLRRFSRLSLEPGEEWPVQLLVNPPASSAKTGPSSGETTADGLPIIGYVPNETAWRALGNLILVALVLAFSLVGVRRTRSRFFREGDDKPWQQLVVEKQSLMEQMLRLEEDYRDQLLGETIYREIRTSIKSKLVDIQVQLMSRENR